MHTRIAKLTDLDTLTTLFDAYRVWYGQAPNLEGAHAFLKERMEKQESQIFLAEDEHGQAAGFTQLYPSFTSVGMARIYVLNDLFIVEAYRRKGVGRLLLHAARDWAKDQGAIRLHLETAADNLPAQALYVDEGYVHDASFLHFDLALL